ncbi:hypothetical protein GCM10023169_26150 [Georgenia halophila]|uniref:Sulfatase-modifying factor enzyme-like domain-containing protein n=1 Tax=Georgenia halophila TaxID=620889 RepID=A0ABP8LDC0_9MICO
MTAPTVETVLVPAGRVTLNDRRTQRSRLVDIAPYRLGRTQITRGAYAAVLGLDPPTEFADRPVDSVSWWDVVTFCNALSTQEGLSAAYDMDEIRGHAALDAAADGYRLPMAEWEHACRAGTSGPRYGDLDEVAWYRGNSGERSHDVATKQRNLWELHDMLGNVWEWCSDLYDADVYGAYRVLRGGGWFDEHWSCRASVGGAATPASGSTTSASASHVASGLDGKVIHRSKLSSPRGGSDGSSGRHRFGPC